MAPSALSLPTSVSDEKYANVKWEELGFGFCRTDNMYVAKCKHGESFQEGKIVPYADLQISPCSAVLNYGQSACRSRKGFFSSVSSSLFALGRLCSPSPDMLDLLGSGEVERSRVAFWVYGEIHFSLLWISRVLCRRGVVAKGLVTVASALVCSCGSVAGARSLRAYETRVEGGCDRGESVRSDFFVRVFFGSPRVVVYGHERSSCCLATLSELLLLASCLETAFQKVAVEATHLCTGFVDGGSECLLVLGCGQSVGGALYELALVAFTRHFYSGNVKGIPDICGNAENLTFPRVTLMVENSYRYRRISKTIIAECAGFSGWAKLELSLSPLSTFSLGLSSHLPLNLTLRHTDVASERVPEPEGSLLLCLVFLFALGRLCSPSPDMLDLLGSNLRRRWKLQSRGTDTRISSGRRDSDAWLAVTKSSLRRFSGVIHRLRVSIQSKLTSRRRGDWFCSFYGGEAGVSCTCLETAFQKVAVEATHLCTGFVDGGSECLLVLGCGQSVGGALYELALVAFARHFYSGNVKGTPGIRGNAENLTFPRVTLMVENSYRYRRISKNILTECAGFSGWAKLGGCVRPRREVLRVVTLIARSRLRIDFPFLWLQRQSFFPWPKRPEL
ncbi:hypothetical protein F2Q69_00031023 [Brassica cretica]|uniref:Uncharacterized protein n=1 Tax=Brassica cretica TaxID=69181 RepID=A0A8S9RRK4_BRACR|nr:hypothetical protein F2Q69_00031023 [Brassica cretica]